MVEILKLVGNLEQKKPLKGKKSFSSIYENLNWWLRGLDSISTRSPGPHGKNFKQTIFPFLEKARGMNITIRFNVNLFVCVLICPKQHKTTESVLF